MARLWIVRVKYTTGPFKNKSGYVQGYSSRDGYMTCVGQSLEDAKIFSKKEYATMEAKSWANAGYKVWLLKMQDWNSPEEIKMDKWAE